MTSHSAADVGAEDPQAQFDELLAHGALRGAVLTQAPVLELADGRRARRAEALCAAVPPRVRLGVDIAALPSEERRFALSHELAHVHLWQTRQRPRSGIWSARRTARLEGSACVPGGRTVIGWCPRA